MADVEKQRSDALKSLAQQINEEHRRCKTAMNTVLEYALRAGDLLEIC
jgi:hypothetical protein